jgi:hypothetical protein
MVVLSPTLQLWAGNVWKMLPRIGFAIWALSLLGGVKVAAQTAVATEYQVKAVFLFNFTQFVDWQPTAFTNAAEPFCIGIVGDDPFKGFLDETVKGEKVSGHPLVVRRCAGAGDVTGCQIIFINRSMGKQAEPVLAGLRGADVLTVGESEGFINDGGMIGFATEQNKIHLKINLAAAKEAHLTISSKLLRLADIVEPGKDRR